MFETTDELLEMIFEDETHRREVVAEILLTTPARHRDERRLGCACFGPILVYAGLDPADGPCLMAFLLIAEAEIKERRDALLDWMFQMQDTGVSPVPVEFTLTPDRDDFAAMRIILPEELADSPVRSRVRRGVSRPQRRRRGSHRRPRPAAR